MKKTHNSKSLLLALLLLVASSPVGAQSTPDVSKARLAPKLTLQQQQQLAEEFHRKNPLLASTKYLGAKKTTLQQAHTAGAPALIGSRQQKAVPFRAPSGTQIWADIYYSSGWAG